MPGTYSVHSACLGAGQMAQQLPAYAMPAVLPTCGTVKCAQALTWYCTFQVPCCYTKDCQPMPVHPTCVWQQVLGSMIMAACASDHSRMLCAATSAAPFPSIWQRVLGSTRELTIHVSSPATAHTACLPTGQRCAPSWPIELQLCYVSQELLHGAPASLPRLFTSDDT